MAARDRVEVVSKAVEPEEENGVVLQSDARLERWAVADGGDLVEAAETSEQIQDVASHFLRSHGCIDVVPSPLLGAVFDKEVHACPIIKFMPCFNQKRGGLKYLTGGIKRRGDAGTPSLSLNDGPLSNL